MLPSFCISYIRRCFTAQTISELKKKKTLLFCLQSLGLLKLSGEKLKLPISDKPVGVPGSRVTTVIWPVADESWL